MTQFCHVNIIKIKPEVLSEEIVEILADQESDAIIFPKMQKPLELLDI